MSDPEELIRWAFRQMGCTCDCRIVGACPAPEPGMLSLDVEHDPTCRLILRRNAPNN